MVVLYRCTKFKKEVVNLYGGGNLNIFNAKKTAILLHTHTLIIIILKKKFDNLGASQPGKVCPQKLRQPLQ